VRNKLVISERSKVTNNDARKVLDYCDTYKVKLLRLDIIKETFLAEREDGTPVLCSFSVVDCF